MKDFCIVGSGVAGSTIANLLAKKYSVEIFDKAKDQAESRTSIAEKVAESLNVSCNRKLVRKVLDEQRSSDLKKLKKIS